MKKSLLSLLLLFATISLQAQSFTWTSSTQDKTWQQKSVKLTKKITSEPTLTVGENDEIITFKAWGTSFNELGWDALNMLPRAKQEEILANLFAPGGEIGMTMSRIPMNANDYARDWYSCNEVSGDFQLKYFNIDRDKTTLIPYIKAAMQYNPDLTFWISPWSPPSWMKINHDYPVVSNREYNKQDPRLDYLLFEDSPDNRNEKVFPQRLAVNDYLIQEPRYLQAYADYFCKFISAYETEGIPVHMVMFQNEAWSYTPYPGCAWTPQGIIRFNVEYLAPTLKEQHPNVDLYLGTINTNRFDFIDEVLSDSRMPSSIKGVGFQWEGGQILPDIRKKYPQYKYVQTESECGWGSFDWYAGEHTFQLINHYLSNGCEEYTFWNAILADNGVSGWGWKQNALIRVDSNSKTATYTPEYLAVKHYASYITPGTKIVAATNVKEDRTPILAAINPKGKHVILAGNFNDSERTITVSLKGKQLQATLAPHSFNTFEMK